MITLGTMHLLSSDEVIRVDATSQELRGLTSDFEICYVCTDVLRPADAVHPIDDSQDLRWYAHEGCIRRVFVPLPARG